jgi:hypothetical protein
MIISGDLGRVSGQFHDICQHHPFLMGDGSSRVVAFERIDQGRGESYATQKLCVRFDSIDATVGDRHQGSDHLVLPSGEG